MTFFRDLAASFQIFASNFTARFGVWVNGLLILLVLAGAGFFVLRAAAVSLKARKLDTRLQTPPRNEEREARLARRLSQAIQIPTVTGDEKALDQFHRWMEREFPLVFAAMRPIYTLGSGLLLQWRSPDPGKKQPALFCAHMDVTPVEGQKWAAEPFGGQIQDGYVYGRGALDCKGVLTGLLSAAEELLEQGFEPGRDVYFAFGSDEETGGRRGAANIAQEIRRRGLHFDLILDEGGHIAPAHLGNPRFPAALVGVAEKGSAVFQLTAKAKAGHAAAPPEHTAAGSLAEAICRIEAAAPRKRLLPAARRALVLSAPAMGFWQRVWAANLPAAKRLLFWSLRRNPQLSALFHTTFAVTQIQGGSAANVLPETARATVDARLLQGDTGEKILDYLKALTADLPVTVEMSSCQQPSPLSPYQGNIYQTVVSAVEEIYGRISCIPVILPAGTDSKHYQEFSENILRFVPMPANPQTLAAVHGADERLSCQSFAAGVDFYESLLRRL